MRKRNLENSRNLKLQKQRTTLRKNSKAHSRLQKQKHHKDRKHCQKKLNNFLKTPQNHLTNPKRMKNLQVIPVKT
jgi:hypothetical protein